MHARLPIRFRTNDTVIDTCIVFISVYFNIVTLTRHCTYSQSQKYIKRQHKSTHTRFTQWWKWPKFTSSLGGGVIMAILDYVSDVFNYKTLYNLSESE